MADENDDFEQETDEEVMESELLSQSEIDSCKIRMDARRKLEYMQELRELKKALGEDYYDNLLDGLDLNGNRGI